MNLIEKFDTEKEVYALEPTTVAECGIIKLLSKVFPENFEYALVDKESTRYSSKDFRIEHSSYPILIIKDFKEWVSEQSVISIKMNDGDAFTGTGTLSYGAHSGGTTATDYNADEDLTGSVLKKDEEE